MSIQGATFGKQLSEYTVEQLREAIAFLDCDGLRGSYTGYLAELRRELRARTGIDSGHILPPRYWTHDACGSIHDERQVLV